MHRLLRLLAVIACLSAAPAARAEPRPPNLLLIVVDDIGWGELGFQGERQIPTPHIDSIAAAGVRFQQAYVTAPFCGPSRAGLLTGRYQARFGFEVHGTQRNHGIPAGVPTLAEKLSDLGYETMAIGKWGVGDRYRFLPMSKGFDGFFGTVDNSPFVLPPEFIDTRISDAAFPVADRRFYTTLAYADRAARWIGERRDAPWFLYVSFNAAHHPLQAPRSYLERFSAIRQPTRRTYAAVTAALDDAVGAILRAVRATGRERETLVAFISDNGGPTWQTSSSNGPLRGNKATLYEGGIRVPFSMTWPAAIPAGGTFVRPVSSLDLVPTFLAAAGAPPDPFGPVDGVDLLPHLRGETLAPPHPVLYWKVGRQWAVRFGDWKLVESDTTRVDRIGGRPLGVPTVGVSRPQLFHLASDPGERRDLRRRALPFALLLERLWNAWDGGNPPPLLPPNVHGQ